VNIRITNPDTGEVSTLDTRTMIRDGKMVESSNRTFSPAVERLMHELLETDR
jgi:hypothetical protein